MKWLGKHLNKILAGILLLYPLRHAVLGADLMDAGYALGNYRFFDVMNPMWKLATYFANIVGVLLSYLPFGDTWIGMNVYTGLLIGLTAMVVFLFLFKRYEHRWLLFAGELTALSLCWAPSVILYHYLGYLFMTAATLILFMAITKDNKWYFIAAGMILGLCVSVRMPNITYMAFILPVWYVCFVERKECAWIKKLINRTVFCIVGYLVGLLAPIFVIVVRYGAAAYPEMIASLFGMTETATDYKPSAMVFAMFGDYFRYSVWLFLFVGYMVMGSLFFSLILAKNKKKASMWFKLIYAAGLLVLLRFCYGRGMFDFDYTAYFSIYKWAVVYLLMVLALCIWSLISKKVSGEQKLWAVCLLVTIWITPLGSNNGLYPIINNLFLTAPVSLLMLFDFFQKLSTQKYKFVLKITVCFLFLCTALQSLLFGIGFVFHDVLPAGEQRYALHLQSSGSANGIWTTKDKKEQLEALDNFLIENELNTKQLILFGDIPALSYLFDMEPAIFTTWIDLDSNQIEQLRIDLDRIAQTQDFPVIIFGRKAIDTIDKANTARYEKLVTIQQFMRQEGYFEAYVSEEYIVYWQQFRLGLCTTLQSP